MSRAKQDLIPAGSRPTLALVQAAVAYIYSAQRLESAHHTSAVESPMLTCILVSD